MENIPYKKFESIFKEHYAALAGYAFSILRNKEDAEDVTQDVFIRTWQSAPNVFGEEGVSFYLRTAVRNGCISFLRKERSKMVVTPDDARLHQQPEEERDASPDPALFVEQALAELPPQCGLIFKMSRFGGLSYQQIADELGLSVKTVENQVGKALKLMRAYARDHNISFVLLMLALHNYL